MKKIKISAGDISIQAELNSTPTAQAIWEKLPIEGSANTWGDEIYFSIPVSLAEADDAREILAVGDLGYWPPGHAFCIFFGKTPASHGKEPRAASPVNVFGSLLEEPTDLRKVRQGARIYITRLPDDKG